MRIWPLLERAAALYPHEPAVADGGLRLSYGEVAGRAQALARCLAGQGVAPGDRVAILAPNGAPYLEAYFAAAGLGAILCPLNTRLTAGELGAILRDAGAGWLLADPELAAPVRQLVADGVDLEGLLWLGEADSSVAMDGEPFTVLSYDRGVRDTGPFEPVDGPDDAVAQLYYTSGTTGQPKGVMLTHGNVTTHALAAVAELGLSDGDTWGHFAPMFHLADAWATFAVTWVGGRHVMLPRFEAEPALEAIARERVTVTNLVPTMLGRMVSATESLSYDLSSLRLVLSGGAPIAPDLVRRVMDTFGCEYMQTYGMTETSPYLTLSRLKAHLADRPEAERFRYRARTGRPFLTVSLEVVDEAGRPVPPDDQTVGEIVVRGPTVTPGYWQRPEETAAAFRDGWLLTGDLATVDDEGYVNIVDRKKDVIITGGEKVYSVEVENVLYRHPAVLEALVYGVPDPDWGECVHAAVALRPGASAGAEELVAHCRAALAGFKVPRRISFHESLPRTGSGKLTKQPLRAAAAARTQGSWPATSSG